MHDDVYFIVHNTAIDSISNACQFFVDPATVATSLRWRPLYRPLRTLSFALDVAIWGKNPLGFHVTNLILHLLNGLGVWLFARRILAKSWGAFVAASLFAVHPVQTEAVSWISSRGDLLMMVFVLIALATLNYQPEKTRARVRACVGYSGLTLALFAKETAIILPCIIVLVDWYQAGWKIVSKNLLKYTIAAAICVGYFGVRLVALGGNLAQQEYWGGALAPTILTMTKVLVKYLRLVVAPIYLTVEYPIPIAHSPFEWQVIASSLLLVGLGVIAVLARRKEPILSFALIWFGLWLAPVSNLIPITALMAERFLYPALIGPLLLIGWVGERAINRCKALRVLGVIVPVCVIVVFTLMTQERNREWRNELSLWTATVQRAPESARAQHNYGNALLAVDEVEPAHQALQQALVLQPDYPLAHATLGKIYLRKNDQHSAMKHLRTALKDLTGVPWIHNELGTLLLQSGDLEGARREFETALQVQPANPSTHVKLAMLALATNDRDTASAMLQRALDLDPHSAEALNAMGVVYAQSGDLDNARRYFQRAVEQSPNFPEAWKNLIRAATMQGDAAGAARYERQALERQRLPQ